MADPYQQKNGRQNFRVQKRIPLVTIPKVQRDKRDDVADQNRSKPCVDGIFELNLTSEHRQANDRGCEDNDRVEDHRN